MSDVGEVDVFFDGCEMPMSHGQDVVKGDYDGLYVIYFLLFRFYRYGLCLPAAEVGLVFDGVL